MEKLKIKRLLIILATVLVVAFSLITGDGVRAVYAATSVVSAYEQTNVLDDLEGATVGGEAFDLKVYNFDESKQTQVITLIEFCYSFYSNKQSDYGLYVYVYNPQGLDFVLNSSKNAISMSVGENEASYTKYNLTYINSSAKANYEGLFIKYKIQLSDSQKQTILSTVNSTERVYTIGEFELLQNGNYTATAFTPTGVTSDSDATTIYKFSGYASGYGNSSSDTLTCTTSSGDVLHLKPQSTYFRGSGTNGTAYTQDTLHSVYFAVPNSIVEAYGYLTKVHATWLNAQTTPMLIIGSHYYSTVLEHLNEDIGIPSDYSDMTFNYFFRTNEATEHLAIGGTDFYSYLYGYNYPSSFTETTIVNYISAIQWLFKATNGNADNYDVSSETIIKYMQDYTSQYGGDKVADKYSNALFANVDELYTEMNIEATEEFSLTSEKTDKNFWEKLFGGSHVVDTEEFNNISKIEAVDYSVFNNSKQSDICRSLYINESDYSDFYKYCAQAQLENKTVYLLRYYVSDYLSVELKEGEIKQSWSLTGAGGSLAIAPGYVYSEDNTDTNAYLSQQWLQLDFDIIDVTFSNGETETVIPVVMSPMDIAADATHPLVTTADPSDFWKYALGIAAALVVVWTIYRAVIYRR
jgi:hypothetical protein